MFFHDATYFLFIRKSFKASIIPKAALYCRLYPAVSRRDGKPVCPRCGTMEALQDAGIDEEKIEEILEMIYGEGSEVDIYRDDG